MKFCLVEIFPFPLPPNSQWFNNLFNEFGVGFFDMFFVAEWVEGISCFCFVVFVALALGELAFSRLLLGTLTIVLDIVTKFIQSDIPFSGKVFEMVVDNGFNHSVQDTSDRLSLVIFRIGLDFFPQVSDDFG